MILRSSTGGMDMQASEVLAKLQGFGNGNIGKILVAEYYSRLGQSYRPRMIL